MKKLVFIVLSFLFFNICEAQKLKTEIYLKNGDTLTGFSNNLQWDYIKFSKTKRRGYKNYGPKEITGAKTYSTNGIKYYVIIGFKKNIKKKKIKYRLAEIIMKGTVNYYKHSYTFGQSTGFKQNPNPAADNGFKQSEYFVKRKDEKLATYLSTGGQVVFAKNFKKSILEYFKDCPKLISKIEKDTSKKRNISEIVEFYNNQCN